MNAKPSQWQMRGFPVAWYCPGAAVALAAINSDLLRIRLSTIRVSTPLRHSIYVDDEHLFLFFER